MIKFIKEQFIKYKEAILYLFFGGATTVLNTVCYALLYEYLHISNLISTIVAWTVAVIFAFITNKLFVFESRTKQINDIIKELASFFGCRLLTGILDVVIMLIAVDLMHWNSLLWKLLSNILVIILNYFASKFFIFKKDSGSK